MGGDGKNLQQVTALFKSMVGQQRTCSMDKRSVLSSSYEFLTRVVDRAAAQDEGTTNLKANKALITFKLDTGSQVKELWETPLAILKKGTDRRR